MSHLETNIEFLTDAEIDEVDGGALFTAIGVGVAAYMAYQVATN